MKILLSKFTGARPYKKIIGLTRLDCVKGILKKNDLHTIDAVICWVSDKG